MKCVYGWAGGQAGLLYVITKFSLMGSLPNFLTHSAPLRALRARESSAIIHKNDDSCVLLILALCHPLSKNLSIYETILLVCIHM